MADLERLQKYMARSGIGSRRGCEELISQGRVAVNGVIVRQLGIKVDPAKDVVAVNGDVVAPEPHRVYVMLNKPAGFITTVEEQWGRPTVMDLIRDPAKVFATHERERQKAINLAERRLFPAGRLDLNTEGLLLFTDDGELANRLTHPRYALDKEYLVGTEGTPAEEAIRRLREGVEIDGKPTAPARVKLLRDENGSAWLTVIIHEGRKRQIRLMFEAVGRKVRRLIRVRIGPLSIGNLPVGRYRFLGQQEVEALRRAVARGS